MRLLLSALLAFWTPCVQAAEPSFDALSHLLHSYAGPVDEKVVEAASEEGVTPGSGARLARISSDLSLMAGGFEAFRHPSHAQHALKDLPDRIVPELRPFFKDRDSTLDAVYRTLAVADYTWALRFPEPPCDSRSRRKSLLASKDGLFADPKTGDLSPWLSRLLGPSAGGRTAEEALDRASGKQGLSARDYELVRVKAAKITEALSSEKAVGKERAKLYCLRAEAHETLAFAHRAAQGGPIQASRGAVAADAPGKEASSVLLLAVTEGPNRFRAVGAGVMIETPRGPKVLTDARLMPAEGEDKSSLRGFARAQDGTLDKPRVLFVERTDQASGVMVGRLQEGDGIPALKIARGPAARREFLRAIGHMGASGAWTVSQGLVTETGDGTFVSDAILGPDMLGGPLLNDAGEVVGLVVLSPGAGAPVAVQVEHLRRVADGDQPAAKDLEFLAARQTGSGSLLTAVMPIVGELSIPGGGAIEAGLHMSNGGVAWGGGGGVGNWRPKSSAGPPSGYSRSHSAPSSSYGSGKSAGTEIGEALAPLVEALIFRGIPALFRKIGRLLTPKAKASTANTSTAKVAQKATPPPPVKKDPPILTGLTLETTPDRAPSGEVVTLTARLTLSDPQASKANIPVSFKAKPETLVRFAGASRAKTDASGTATTTVTLRRDHGVRQVKTGDMKAVQKKSTNAHNALDDEVRAMSADPSGTAEPGVEDEKDETVEFEGRATVGVSLVGTASVVLSQAEIAKREKALAQSVGFAEIKEICFIDNSLSTEDACIYRCDIYIDGKLVQSGRLRSEHRNGGLCPPNFTDIKVVPK